MEAQGEFIYPCYEDYCFSNIPRAVLNLFRLKDENQLSKILASAGITTANPKKIVLLLIDALGYNQLMKYGDRYEIFRRFKKKGVIVPLTTVFPSTTTATLATIHSGLTPQEHGLLEWRMYFEELDKAVFPILFTTATETIKRDQLLEAGINPEILFDRETVYEILSDHRVPSFVFLRNDYCDSVYTRLVCRGSTTVPFINSSDLIVNLRKTIETQSGLAYFYAYWDNVDTIAHAYGPHSDQYLAELNGFFYLLQKEFIEKLGKTAEEVAIIITADHGQINVDPQETIYLDQYPEVETGLRVGPSGDKIVPWGSSRDFFLAIKPEKLNEVFEFLTETFHNKAVIIKSSEALDRGLFGRGRAHDKFISRIGDILILPHGNLTVWYEYFKNHRLNVLGMHGGLTAEEMLVPFIAARAAELV